MTNQGSPRSALRAWALAGLVAAAACGGGTDGESNFIRRCPGHSSCPELRSEDAGSKGAGKGKGQRDDADAGGSTIDGEGDAGPGGSGDGPNGDGPSGDGSNGDGPNGDGPNGDGSSGGPVDNPGAPRFDCSEVRSQQFDPDTMTGYRVSQDVLDQVDSTLQAMGPAEMASQMIGVDGSSRDYRDIMRTPDVDVAGVGTVRGFRFRDAGRGVSLDHGQDNRPDDGNNFSTAFPTESLRAATWNVELERRIGAAIGDETAAAKNNALVGPSADLLRHPYWGRAQESYGEDPYLVGRMATAYTAGAQEYVMACAMHFAGYGVEKQRAIHNAVLSEQALREIYTRPFEMVVRDGGVGCVLAAYNLVNGVKMTQNLHLLREVLKGPVDAGGMGFQGLVITDWWAMPGDQNVPDPATAQAVTLEALRAGTDIELPWTLHYTTGTLANADATDVEAAARRILTQKYRFGSALSTDPWSLETPTSTLESGSIAPNATHEALAEQAALEGAVLLVNGIDPSAPVLPFASPTEIAVVGVEQEFSLVSSSVPKSCSAEAGLPNSRECTFRFALDPALGDRGSARVNADPARSVGPFQGISEAAGAGITVTSGNSAEAAATADAVVVVVGYTPEDEGEEYPIADGGDRDSLALPPGHAELVASVLDLDKPTVIVVATGSIVNLPWLSHPNQNQATVWAGYAGLRGGAALGKLLFGQANFSGKLPMAWPEEAELPPFRESETSTRLDYHFGYREFDRRQYVEGTPVDLLFPFGHGLSYSSFEYANLGLPCETVTKDAIVRVTVDVTNTSSVDGDEVLMLFVKPPPAPAGAGERPWKELRSFARVSVPAGQAVTAVLPLRIRDLRRWAGDEDGGWVTDSGDYTVLVGKSAADAEAAALAGTVTVSGD